MQQVRFGLGTREEILGQLTLLTVALPLKNQYTIYHLWTTVGTEIWDNIGWMVFFQAGK